MKLIQMQKIGRMDYDNPKCPKCKSTELNFGAYEPVDDYFKQEIECKYCKCWFTIYTLKPRYWEIWADDGYFHIEVKDETKHSNK